MRPIVWAWLSFWLLPLNNMEKKKKMKVTILRTLILWSTRKRLMHGRTSHCNYYLLRFFLSGVSCTCALIPYVFNWKFSNASETASTCNNTRKVNKPLQMSANKIRKKTAFSQRLKYKCYMSLFLSNQHFYHGTHGMCL